MSEKKLQEAVATAVPGSVETADGVLSARTHVDGEDAAGTTTPEHLMAAATAACLHQAIGIAASSQDVDASSAQVEGTVHLTTAEDAGYTGHFALVVTGLPADSAQRVLDQAQQICPFTKALSAADLTVSLG